MSKYRLHIDVPLSPDRDTSVEKTEAIIKKIIASLTEENGLEITLRYRLGHDEDRSRKNHLDLNENGHVTNKIYSVDLNSKPEESE